MAGRIFSPSFSLPENPNFTSLSSNLIASLNAMITFCPCLIQLKQDSLLIDISSYFSTNIIYMQKGEMTKVLVLLNDATIIKLLQNHIFLPPISIFG